MQYKAMIRLIVCLMTAVAIRQAEAQTWTYGSCSSIPSDGNTGFRLTKILDQNSVSGLNCPVKMALLMDSSTGGKVDIIFIERFGKVRYYNATTGTTTTIGTISTNEDTEDGLVGLAIEKPFKNRIFVYYSHAATQPTNNASAINGSFRLSRINMDPTTRMLDMSSEKVILNVPSARDRWHTGGALNFDSYGDLWINSSDNQSLLNGPGNTSSMRGAVLRIHPNEDGTYSIPAGNFGEYYSNFFTKQGRTTLAAQYLDTSLVRPEIYVKGIRNVYVGNVDPITRRYTGSQCGPDFGGNTEELFFTTHPIFKGWPIWAGITVIPSSQPGDYGNVDNEPSSTDWPTYVNAGISRTKPVNSWHGSGTPRGGVDSLPPTFTPQLYYNHACAMGALIYQYDGRINNPNKLPPQMNNLWLVGDYDMRALYAFKLSSDTTIASTDPTNLTSGRIFSSLESANTPTIEAMTDMKIGPDGDLYLLNLDCNSNTTEGGSANVDACTSIVKIDYTGTACSDTSLYPPTSVQQTSLRSDANWLMLGDQSFSILTEGPHSVEIMDARGRMVENLSGQGRETYNLSKLEHNAVFYMLAKTQQGNAFKPFFHN